MRDVAVVGFAQRQMKEFDGSPTCVELLVPILAECYEQTGFTRKDIGFWCSGSSDYLAGRSFSFVVGGRRDRRAAAGQRVARRDGRRLGALRGLDQDPDRRGRHRAGLRLRQGSAGVLRRTLALQLDPYTMTPLWPDTVSLAALQARAGIDAGLWDERAMAEVANRSLHRRREERVRHPQGRLVASRSCWPDPCTPTRCASTTAHRSPTARPRSCSPPATGPTTPSTGRPGSPASRTTSTRSTSVGAT